MPTKIEISFKTIALILVTLFALWFIVQIKEIILMVFVGIILMSAFNPLVDKLEKVGLPRSLVILVLYILVWVIVGGLVASIVPGLMKQTSKLIETLPTAVSHVDFFSSHQQEFGQQILTRVGTLPEDIIKLSIELFGNILTVLTTLVIAFYLLLYRKQLNQFLAALFGTAHKESYEKIFFQIEQRLGSWVRGEFLLMLAVGIMTYIGLIMLNIDMALPLAVLAGFLEILPNIGPIISAVPAVLVAFLMNPLIGFATTALYFAVQFIENNFLVPKIMQSTTGVNPLISILSLMIGLKISGSIGAILAIPTVLVVYSFIENFAFFKKINTSLKK